MAVDRGSCSDWRRLAAAERGRHSVPLVEVEEDGSVAQLRYSVEKRFSLVAAQAELLKEKYKL